MSENEGNPAPFSTKSGWLCLDFANTAEWHRSDQPEERLNGYSDLIAWAQAAGAIDQAEAKSLRKASLGRPEQAEKALHKATALREAVYRVFSNVAHRQPLGEPDLRLLSDAVREANQHLALTPSEGGAHWEWKSDEGDLERPLWAVARSAAELLTSDVTLGRVGECADDRCGWLFIDTSRNHSRRWCDMKDCGNRAKARRHYQRERKESATQATP